MIRDEAERLSVALQKRFGSSSGLSCAVEPLTKEVGFNAPGGGRPKIVRYRIVVSGGGREAHLTLGEAEELLHSVGNNAPADSVFAEIASVTGTPEGSG